MKAASNSWTLIGHRGGPKDYWRTLSAGTQDEALTAYRTQRDNWPEQGGLRLLNEKGLCVRFYGEKGKP